MLQTLRHGVFSDVPHPQILLDRRQTVLRAPYDNRICTQRKQTSSRHLATARQYDVVCASVPPFGHRERAQVATKRGARLALLPIWI